MQFVSSKKNSWKCEVFFWGESTNGGGSNEMIFVCIIMDDLVICYMICVYNNVHLYIYGS